MAVATHTCGERPTSGHDMPERKERLPRSERLRKTSAFRRVYDTGDARRGRTLVLIVRPAPERRVGFVASRKVGDAVRRNRARRRLREAYRRLRSRFTPTGLESHIVFVARRAILNADPPAVLEEMEHLLVSAGLLELPGKSHDHD